MLRALAEDRTDRRRELALAELEVELAHLVAESKLAVVPGVRVLRVAVHHLGDRRLVAAGALEPGIAVAHDRPELGRLESEAASEREADCRRAPLEVHIGDGIAAEERAQAPRQVLHGRALRVEATEAVLAVAARRVEAGRVDVEPRQRFEQVQAFGLGLARGLEDLREDRAINVLALRLGPRGAVRQQSMQDLGFIDGRPTTSRALCDSILRVWRGMYPQSV
jgi:hypothetical protein